MRRFVDPARAFRAWGCAGTAAAVAVGMGVAAANRLELAMMAAIASAAMATFLALALCSALAGGSVRLVYYHHELSILAAAWALLLLAGRLPLPYLDATVLGVGAFLALGRVGCLMAGCCHGRPAGCGIRYGAVHAAEGFPAHLTGVPLLPVQSLEAVGVAAIVATGVAMALHGPPGAALTWYVAAYGILRFGLELIRGDADRPHWLGFSQAQWYSTVLVAGSSAGGLAGVLPGTGRDVVVLAGLLAAMVALAAARRRPASAHRLLSPQHTAELAGLLAAIGRSGRPDVHLTSIGLRVSAGSQGPVEHVTLSSERAPLTAAQARAVGRLVAALRHAPAVQVVAGSRAGVHHVLLEARPVSGAG